MGLLTYKKFFEREEAKELTDILEENGIAFVVTEYKETLDSLYGDKNFSKQYFVKIDSEDFDKADSLLNDAGEKASEAVGKDHYLYEFSDEELFDILSKPDEWNEMDFHLARRILRERGKEIQSETVELLKKQRLKELSKPEESSKAWIYAGYLFAFLGGFLGIFMGISFLTAKKLLPNGQKVPAYSSNVRNHGMKITIIGMIMFIISIAIKISRTDF